jgi:hypothetical protein
MSNILGWITLVCGILWILYSLIMNTKNLKSSVVYKVIPFFTGLSNIFVTAVLWGWINIG